MMVEKKSLNDKTLEINVAISQKKNASKHAIQTCNDFMRKTEMNKNLKTDSVV